jgi:hypothetical protein
MTRALRAVGAISEEALARHAPAARLETLEDVLRWGGHVLEVIVQDEYTHDVVVHTLDAGFLVFDTT